MLRRLQYGCLALLASTACLAEVARTKIAFEPSQPQPGEAPVACLAREVEVSPSVGLEETLAQGSCWRRVGRTARGDVLRPVGTVFMLTSANAHEAYLVVGGGALVGFYLPGEGAFAPVAEVVPLPLVQRGEDR